MKKQILYDIFQAYYDARKNKRNTHDQLKFENYKKDCYILKLDISGYFMSMNKKKVVGKNGANNFI